MPLHFLILVFGSWISRQQGEAIEYLRAKNRVLRARVGTGRLRFTDAERRLLAQKGRALGQSLLSEMATLATPETILRWYRERVVSKYDGSRARGALGRGAADVAHHLVLGERHLLQVPVEYCRYFNETRPHQGIDQLVPCGPSPATGRKGSVVATAFLNGLHHDYRRAA